MMNTQRKLALSAITAVLMASSGLAGATDLYQRRSTVHTNLSPLAGVQTTVVSVAVPAGSWRVIAKASVVNWGVKDYARCYAYSNTTQIDSAATMIGELSNMPAVATLTNIGAINTTATTTFSLRCSHDFGVSGELVDPGATLTVERISSGSSL